MRHSCFEELHGPQRWVRLWISQGSRGLHEASGGSGIVAEFLSLPVKPLEAAQKSAAATWETKPRPKP